MLTLLREIINKKSDEKICRDACRKMRKENKKNQKSKKRSTKKKRKFFDSKKILLKR